jgi:hypothetical protein
VKLPIITLDFETFYSDEYSLRKMTPLEYICDARFETIGASFRKDEVTLPYSESVKTFGAKSVWLNGPDLPRLFARVDWSKTALMSHNVAFDGAILAWRYGIVPALYIDTLGMSRAAAPHAGRASLDAMLKYLNAPPKGDAIHNAKGWRLADFMANPAFFDGYKTYANRDCDGCFWIFEALAHYFSGVSSVSSFHKNEEFLLMDMVARMTMLPQFSTNRNVLYAHLKDVVARKEKLIDRMRDSGLLDEKDARKTFQSNEAFANMLRALGVDPPTKISPTTGKETYAFSKQDKDFTDLLEYEDDLVQAAVAARLGVKSTLEETRSQRFIDISMAQWPYESDKTIDPALAKGADIIPARMPFPLKYSGAHTHRLSGDWSLNLQNLGRKSRLRESIIAPPGHEVVSADASQIEARVVSWLAGCTELVEAFASKEDVYSTLASSVYDFPVNKHDHPGERFVGKTCLSAGTRVLTRRGWIPIIHVRLNDQLWDGEEWVDHDGVCFMGVKPTISLSGLELTPDHEILTGGSRWESARSVLMNASAFASALSLGSLPSSDMKNGFLQQENYGDGLPCADVRAAGPSDHMQQVVFALEGQPRVTPALSERRQKNGGGSTKPLYQTTRNEVGYSTACHPRSIGATTQETGLTGTMESVGFLCGQRGEEVIQSFSVTCRLYLDGMNHREKWTESTTTKDTNPEIYDLRQDQRTVQTGETSQFSKPVFDVLNSGSRNRFTVWTNDGPIIVHNCVLGLGFGMGVPKFKETCRVQGRAQGLPSEMYTLTPELAQRAVSIYRSRYKEIPAYWRLQETAIEHLAMRQSMQMGVLYVDGPSQSIILPNGMRLWYTNMRKTIVQRPGEQARAQWVFDYGNRTKYTFGGKQTENCVQAVARIITMNAATRIRRYGRIGSWRPKNLAGQIHDQLIYVAPKEYAKGLLALVIEEMSKPLDWFSTLPLAAEGGIGPNLLDIKEIKQVK